MSKHFRHPSWYIDEKEEAREYIEEISLDGDKGENPLSDSFKDKNDEQINHGNLKTANSADSEVQVEDQGDGTLASEQILHGVPLLLCSLALLCCMFIVALDQTITSTLFTTVGEEFQAFAKVSWISSAFILPTAVLAMNWAKISIIFGRKLVILVTIVLFEAGSLMCGLSKSMDQLIAGRTISGMGGGGVQVMVLMILTEITEVQKRGFVQGLVGMAYGVASVAGPLVGGFFTSNVSWRWCFYINLPIGGIAFILIWYFFRPPPPRGTWKSKIYQIDFIGTALFAIGFILILLAITFGSMDVDWESPLVVSFLVGGPCLLVMFLMWNFKISKFPLIPSNIVFNFPVVIVCIVYFFVFAAFMMSMIYIATFFQVVDRADAMHAGIDMLPMIIPMVILSVVVGALVSITGHTKIFAVFGTLVATAGFALLVRLNNDTAVGLRILYLLLPGIGIGCLFQSLTLNIQVAAPRANGGVLIATSLMSFSRTCGGVIGSTLGQTLQSVVFRSRLEGDSRLPQINLNYLINEPTLMYEFPSAIQELIVSAYIDGYKAVMYTALGCMAMSSILTLFVTNQKIPRIPKKIGESIVEEPVRRSPPQSPHLRQLTLPTMLEENNDCNINTLGLATMNSPVEKRKRSHTLSRLPSLPLIVPLSPLFNGKRQQQQQLQQNHGNHVKKHQNYRQNYNYRDKPVPPTPVEPSPILSYEIPPHISRLRRNRNSWVLN